MSIFEAIVSNIVDELVRGGAIRAADERLFEAVLQRCVAQGYVTTEAADALRHALTGHAANGRRISAEDFAEVEAAAQRDWAFRDTSNMTLEATLQRIEARGGCSEETAQHLRTVLVGMPHNQEVVRARGRLYRNGQDVGNGVGSALEPADEDRLSDDNLHTLLQQSRRDRSATLREQRASFYPPQKDLVDALRPRTEDSVARAARAVHELRGIRSRYGYAEPLSEEQLSSCVLGPMPGDADPEELRKVVRVAQAGAPSASAVSDEDASLALVRAKVLVNAIEGLPYKAPEQRPGMQQHISVLLQEIRRGLKL